ncbi:DNRLRE domain-containing protein [Neobacillus drentensis]|uniref:CBM96 family carbohydrate-binding protein n=1 Tax=Neobacillus drentensis TaxID=220684 RepID=UPI002FFEFDC1
MKKIMAVLLCTILMVQCIFIPSKTLTVKAEGNEFDNNYVATVDFNQFNKDIEEDELMLTVKEVLLNANKYALGGWFTDKRHFDDPIVNVGKYYNLLEASKLAGMGSTPEYVYRSPASQAFGLAISLKTGIYDESKTGVSEKEATDAAIKLATSVAHENKANAGLTGLKQYQPWGDDWQAAHWAYYAGYAAWLLWDDLDDEQKQLVINMVEYEANRFINQDALYWKSKDGFEFYKGDTKQEEDSWNSELLNLAPHMMPKHENASVWYTRMIEYQLAGFSTPEMNEKTEILHGKEAKYWVNGYNVNSNGTIINHNRVHPAYNASATGINSSIVDSLAGEALPEAARYNLDTVYKGLTEATFDSPPYNQPGGTMYREDGTIYYPEGSDWGQGLYDVYANIDISAYVYGYADKDVAKKWAQLHASKVLEQQGRFNDGHTYNPGEFTYPLNEEAISTRMGSAYMTLWLNEQVGVEFSNKPLVNYPWDEPEYGDGELLNFASESVYVRNGTGGSTDYSKKNFFPANSLEVRKDSSTANKNLESYIKFNTKYLDENPEKVILYLNVEYKGEPDTKATHKAELIDSNLWNEKTVTYNTKPNGTGTIIAKWDVPQQGEMVKIDVTDYVKEAIAGNKGFSIRIFTDEESGNNNIKYSGRFSRISPCLGLTYKEGTVNKSSLKKMIDTASQLNKDKFTERSWNTLIAALDEAKKIVADSNATQEQVNTAESNLKTAIDGLVEVFILGEPIIVPQSATAGSLYSGHNANNVINGSGMSGKVSLNDTHDAQPNSFTSWHTAKDPQKNAWIKVDLGNVYILDEMWIWNMNQSNHAARGLKNVKIEYSLTGNDDDWTELAPEEGLTFTDPVEGYPFQFAQASGSPQQKATNLNDGKNTPVRFNGIQAKYVKVTAHPDTGIGSWGDAYFGLSELRLTYKTADKVELADLYNDYRDIKQENYIDERWTRLKTALDNAKSVLENIEATQEEVNTTLQELKDAKKALMDVQPPVTTATTDGVTGDGAWNTRDVNVKFTADDDPTGTGVNRIETRVDGGDWTNKTELTLTAEGMHNVEYRAVDNAGNVEAVKQLSIGIDKTAPAIEVSVPGDGSIYENSEDLTPQFALTDNFSGVDNSNTTVTLDTNSYKIGTKIPLYTLPLGQHTLVISSIDLAGNKGSTTVHFQTVASIDSLKALVTRIVDNKWIDNAGIANSLQAKLANNDLNSFMNEVKAQNGKHISSEAATYLLRDAQYVLSQK